MMMSTCARKLSASGCAGAGLSSTRVPFAFAIAAARSDAATGVSSCKSNTSAWAMQVAAFSISAGVNAILARGTTMMLFSPFGSTTMVATPVPTSARFILPSICSADIAERSISPKTSVPMQPMSVTSAPNRAAAVA